VGRTLIAGTRRFCRRGPLNPLWVHHKHERSTICDVMSSISPIWKPRTVRIATAVWPSQLHSTVANVGYFLQEVFAKGVVNSGAFLFSGEVKT